jgi:hypothetical protein
MNCGRLHTACAAAFANTNFQRRPILRTRSLQEQDRECYERRPHEWRGPSASQKAPPTSN